MMNDVVIPCKMDCERLSHVDGRTETRIHHVPRVLDSTRYWTSTRADQGQRMRADLQCPVGRLLITFPVEVC